MLSFIYFIYILPCKEWQCLSKKSFTKQYNTVIDNIYSKENDKALFSLKKKYKKKKYIIHLF